MIRVARSQPAPAALAKGTAGCWRDEEVRRRLHSDFLEKCYLCEGPVRPGSFEVDHRVPQDDPEGLARVFDWDNLFPAHHDCNNRRRRRYPAGGLLFPDRDDVEERLVQRLVDAEIRLEPVFVARQGEDVCAQNSAEELNHLHTRGAGFDKGDDLRAAVEDQYNRVLRVYRKRTLLDQSVEQDRVEYDLLTELLRRHLSRRAPYAMLIRSQFQDLADLFD